MIDSHGHIPRRRHGAGTGARVIVHDDGTTRPIPCYNSYVHNERRLRRERTESLNDAIQVQPQTCDSSDAHADLCVGVGVLVGWRRKWVLVWAALEDAVGRFLPSHTETAA